MAEDEEIEQRRREFLASLASKTKDGEVSKTKTEQRVEFIMDLMAQNQWVIGISDRQFAQIWNVSRERVRNLAGEASRNLRRLVREDDETRKDMLAMVIQTFQRLGHKAEKEGSARGLEVAGAMTERFARYYGLEPPKKISLETKDAFAGWTAEEVAHYAETGEKPERLKRGNGSG